MTVHYQLIQSDILCDLLILLSSAGTQPVFSQHAGMQGVFPRQVQNSAFLSTGLHEISVGTILRSLWSLSVEGVICCVSQLS